MSDLRARFCGHSLGKKKTPFQKVIYKSAQRIPLVFFCFVLPRPIFAGPKMPRPIFARQKRPAGGGNPGKLVKSRGLVGRGPNGPGPSIFSIENSRISASGGPFWACTNGAGHKQKKEQNACGISAQRIRLVPILYFSIC